jgi:hypothetical protein
VNVRVCVTQADGVGVEVAVGTSVAVGVAVAVDVGVTVGVGDGVGVGAGVALPQPNVTVSTGRLLPDSLLLALTWSETFGIRASETLPFPATADVTSHA